MLVGDDPTSRDRTSVAPRRSPARACSTRPRGLARTAARFPGAESRSRTDAGCSVLVSDVNPHRGQSAPRRTLAFTDRHARAVAASDDRISSSAGVPRAIALATFRWYGAPHGGPPLRGGPAGPALPFRRTNAGAWMTAISESEALQSHSTSRTPAARRARVAGGAEEPLLARRIRSSKRRCQDAYADPRRRRTRTRSRRLSLRLRERLCSPTRTPRCRSSGHSTSSAPAARRARVAGGAAEPRLARRVRSSKRRPHDTCADPPRRRTRDPGGLSLRLRERVCSPARTPGRSPCLPRGAIG